MDTTQADALIIHIMRHMYASLLFVTSHKKLCVVLHTCCVWISSHVKIKINLGICIAPTQPFRAALDAESRVCYPGNTANRQTQ
jgi:hypothetical protein